MPDCSLTAVVKENVIMVCPGSNMRTPKHNCHISSMACCSSSHSLPCEPRFAGLRHADQP